MKLTVKCFATLMPLTPPGGSLEFHGTDVCDLLRQLSIPESEARINFVNGIGVEMCIRDRHSTKPQII